MLGTGVPCAPSLLIIYPFIIGISSSTPHHKHGRLNNASRCSFLPAPQAHTRITCTAALFRSVRKRRNRTAPTSTHLLLCALARLRCQCCVRNACTFKCIAHARLALIGLSGGARALFAATHAGTSSCLFAISKRSRSGSIRYAHTLL